MGCVQSAFKTDADIEELYSLDKCVGEGVEGQVYLATDKATGKQVAIKLVARGPDLGLGPEKVRREIQLQARLNHVNIVELKQVILTRHHLAIVMTYEGGGDLHAYARAYKVNEEVARYFFRQIVEAVEYCHRSHVAHRDIKLANFLLTTDKPMRVKMCDFGCARQWDTKHVPEKRLGRFSTFAGTPAYMSPQVLQSAFYPTNTYNAVEADVWALGIVLCHMFFGAHTPFWLEPNAFRNEGATMQARIQAMKEQSWADSDEFLKANAISLSPELRDLLDKIFVADEFKRITIKGIKEHPWYTAELPPFLQQGLNDMDAEQALRASLQRATVSLAANRHDTGVEGIGDFATIDLLVNLAQKHRKMPGGSEERVFCLDMAHMELGPLSVSSVASLESYKATPLTSPTAADAVLHRSSSSGSGLIRRGDVVAGTPFNGSLYAVPSSVAAAAIGEHDTDDDAGTQHSTMSHLSSLERVAQTGDRSTHFTRTNTAGEPLDVATAARFKKTLSLRRDESGLLVGSYVLELNDDNPAANGMLKKPSWLNGVTSEGRAADRAARSAHGGVAFFKQASVKESSMHSAVTCNSRTVHGGTAHAASQGLHQPGGIFYKG